jgi:AcrR family transcriptional regulator
MKAQAASTTTRERILRSAIDIMGKEGIDALTTRRVANEAGVNLGLLHYYFISKEALVKEAVLLFIEEQREILSGLAQDTGGGDPLDELSSLFSKALERAMERPGLVFGLVRLLLAQISQTVSTGKVEMEALQRGDAPVGSILQALGMIFARVEKHLDAALGGDQELVARRSIQLFTSLFHPLLYTPFPKVFFGCDVSSPEGRKAYVRGVVADALRPRGR